MDVKNKEIFEQNITNAVSDYVYEYKENYFSCIARIKVTKNKVSVKMIDNDNNNDDIVLLAIQEYFNTDDPKAWAENNENEYEIAKFAVQLSRIINPDEAHYVRKKIKRKR